MELLRPLAVASLIAVPVAACDGDDPFPALPGLYRLESAGGETTPVLVSDEGSIRMYLDSMYVEFAESDTAGDADGFYAGRWRVEHRHAADDSTYFVAHADGHGTWSYTSDRDIVMHYANGGLRTRGTREGRDLYLRQFFSLEIEDWVFRRTERGPDLITDDP